MATFAETTHGQNWLRKSSETPPSSLWRLRWGEEDEDTGKSWSLEGLGFPEPHAAQQQVEREARRFNVLNCGRRWGKTEYAKRKLAEAALRGEPVAYLCPTYKMLSQVFRDLGERLPMAKRLVNEHRLEMPNGGHIDCWSGADAANAIRGRAYALVIIDEAAMIAGLKDAWEKSIRPTLTDMKGSAWFISTPRRGGAFEELYNKGGDGEWMSWKMPSLSNPHLDPEELEEAKKGLSEQAFKQEYMADFEASESDLVHPRFDRMQHVKLAPVSWGDCLARIVGIDPGGGDPTAIIPIGLWQEKDGAKMNAGMNFHQYGEFYRRGDVSLDSIISYLGELQKVGPISKVIVGETGGKVITNSLLRAGFPAERWLGSRDDGLETINWVLESKRLTIDPACTNSIAEFGNYKWTKRRDGDSGERYATSTPHDHHADAMDARRYGISWAVAGYTRRGKGARVGMSWGR